MAFILIIDDDEVLTGTISQMLSEAGHGVQCATDGDIGLRFLETILFDLIITDIETPKMEGMETILEIRKRNITAPIIAISGGGRIDSQQNLSIAPQRGASYVFEKPFDKEPFLGAVRECLSGVLPEAV